MWKGFCAFLENIVTDYGPFKVISGIGFVGGALAGVGAIFDMKMLLAAVLAALFSVFLVLVLALMARRQSLLAEISALHDIVNSYAQDIRRSQGADAFDIESWKEETLVGDNGDSRIKQWITLRVGPTPVKAVCHRCWPSNHNDNDYTYQKKTRIEVRDFNATNLSEGVAHRFTYQWDGHSLWIFVHFPASVSPGEEIRILNKVDWPGYFKGLAKKHSGSAWVEKVEWRFRRKVGQVDYALQFDSSLGVKENELRCLAFPGSPSPTVVAEGGGPTVRFGLHAPPADTDIGFFIERK